MKKLVLVIGFTCLLIAFGAIFFVPAAWFSTPAANAPEIRIKFGENATAADVTDILVQSKILSSGRGYSLYRLIDKAARNPKPGTYTIKYGTSYQQIARILAIGPEREEVKITIIEGWTLNDIQQALKEKGLDLEPGLDSDARPVDFFAQNFSDEFSFLKKLSPEATLEGYLFPDTYRVWKEQLPQALFRKQLQEFSVKTAGYEEIAAKENRSLNEVVILASIIEKEVKRDEDRAIVAGIFMNRLKSGMRLQSDATLNYVLNSGRSRLSIAEISSESLYNTYKYTGLPPGPISNPGQASLKAALFPAKTDYYFFLTDASGKAYFARNLDEHVKNRLKAFGS